MPTTRCKACGALSRTRSNTFPPCPRVLCCCSYGNNNQGQATVPNVVDPYDSTILIEWLQVSAGYNHTCAITLYNDLYCWGSSANGRTTVPATGGADWVYVSAGAKHTCE